MSSLAVSCMNMEGTSFWKMSWYPSSGIDDHVNEFAGHFNNIQSRLVAKTSQHLRTVKTANLTQHTSLKSKELL
jgi:hypothetical protein